jgi:hypothetical protein
VTFPGPEQGEPTSLAAGDDALFLWLAGRKRARTFVARADVETIQLAEVGIADDFEAPQKRQAQRAADSAHDFHYQRQAAQRFDANLDARFVFSGFHQASE